MSMRSIAMIQDLNTSAVIPLDLHDMLVRPFAEHPPDLRSITHCPFHTTCDDSALHGMHLHLRDRVIHDWWMLLWLVVH